MREFLDYIYEKSKAYGRVKRFHGFDFAEDVRRGWSSKRCEEIKTKVENPEIREIKSWVEGKLKGLEGKNPRVYARELEHLIRFISGKFAESPVLSIYLAGLCLERARLIKPRGFGESPKRKGYLDEALRRLDEAFKDEKLRKEVLALKAEVYLELSRVGEKPKDFYEVLEEAAREAPEGVPVEASLILVEDKGKQEFLGLARKGLEKERDPFLEVKLLALEGNHKKAQELFFKKLKAWEPDSFSSPV